LFKKERKLESKFTSCPSGAKEGKRKFCLHVYVDSLFTKLTTIFAFDFNVANMIDILKMCPGFQF
jgi:hypothetical protein